MPLFKTFPAIVTISAFCFAAGCIRPEYVKTAVIDPLGWVGTDTVRLEVDNADTVSRRGLSIIFRLDDTFRPRAIPLTVRVTTPDSLWYEESFTAVLEDRVRVAGDFYEAIVPYRKAAVLMRKGRYVFGIANAGDEIRGIWGAGMIIE